jgi:hypothetical protein
MAVTITSINRGAADNDGTGEGARDAFGKVNTNFSNLKTAAEQLEGRFWTVENSSVTAVVGSRYMANNHAGITYTMPAVFVNSSTALSDIWCINADDASNVTLTPASGDAFFVDGATYGVDTSYALTPGNMVILSPRTTDSEWDLIVVGSGGGWADMTEAVWTGGTQSEVADGATAVAFQYDTDNAYATSGAKLASWSNNGTLKLQISKDGGMAAIPASGLTPDPTSFDFQTAKNAGDGVTGVFSVAFGTYSDVLGARSAVFGTGHSETGGDNFIAGSNNTVNQPKSAAFGSYNTCGKNSSVVFGERANAEIHHSITLAGGMFSAIGDRQMISTVIQAATTDATQTTLGDRWNGNIVIPADTSWAFSALIVARSDETDGNESAAWEIKGLLTRDEAGNTVMVGTPIKQQLAASTNATAWDVVAEADDTNEALAIKVTGEAATNIRWVCKLDISQVGYA